MDDERLKAIQARAKARLFAIPGVHGVGYGPKEVGRELTAEIAIKVYVLSKRPAAEIPPDELIPAEIEGVKTDVIEAPVMRRRAAVPGVILEQALAKKFHDRAEYTVLEGGICVTVKDDIGATNTLGVICVVKNAPTDKRVFALMALHSIVPHYLPTDPPSDWLGKKVGQPEGKDSCCKSSSKIFGRVYNALPERDIALVQLDAGRKYVRQVEQIGLVTGSQPATQPQVKKRGAFTGLSGGQITDFNYTPKPIKEEERGVEYTLRAGYLVTRVNPIPGHPEGGIFADFGDSGSPVLDDQDHIVGIFVAGDYKKVDDASVPGGKRIILADFVTPIGDIFRELETEGDPALQVALEIAVAQQFGQEFTVPKSPFEMLDVPAPAWDEGLAPRDIEEDARRTRLGGWYADLYYRHRAEIEGLVNTNRHVATVWHRRGGAALMHAFGRVLRMPDARVPDTLDGIPLDECIAGFRRVLLRFGSEPLQRDLVAVTPTLPEVGGLCYDEIIAAVARADRSFTSTAEAV